MKKTIFSFIFFLSNVLLFAEKPINTTVFGNIAIKGYDPVAYFSESMPQKGSKKYTIEYKGANWRFISSKNLALFKSKPEKYSPQYGGYCAWAVSEGYTANIDPKSWKIVDGKLYLNYNQDIQMKWESDYQNNITKADKNWPKIIDKK